jgi:diguanylate cyclase (GGDEF)-like protein
VQSADTSVFEHCAQIVQSLLPQVQAVGVLGPAWKLTWVSDPTARKKIGAAVAVLGNPSREPAITDRAGVSVAGKNPVHFLWLRGQGDALAGILAIVWPSQPPRGKGATLVSVGERLAPVLALLAHRLEVPEEAAGISRLAETAEIQSLDEATRAAAGGDLEVDPIDSLLAAFNRLAPCAATLLMVPSWSVERCIASEGFPDAQTQALRELATTYLWPDVRDKRATVILNRARIKGADERIPFRVMATPIERRDSVVGVLLACRPSEGVRFGQREKRLTAKLADRLLEIIEASYDETTGLMNRPSFEAAIGRRLSVSPKIVRCLIYCDLDQLHVINDLFGFECGDRVLRGVARCWERSGMPKRSLVSRLAGDRFVALLENCTLNQARTWADQFRKSIEQRHALDAGTGVQITASIGVVAMTEGSTLDHGLAAAETACKAAKDRGRNRVELFADSDQSLMRRFDDMGVFRRVVEALADGAFTLLAQPIVPLRSRSRPTSYELLVRMNDADGGALAPDMFFSAATRYQLLPKLDRWVLNETVKRLQPYAAQLPEWNISFAINISGQSLGDAEFADFARSTLKGSGIDPKWITLEITESAAIGNLEVAKRFISRMTALGCRFALDDFGTGLSSLAYLKELAVSSIKIDGVFVRDLLSSSRSEAMIEAVMTIAHELRLETVAEFVESQAISERLMAFGVTHGQGYAFGRPQPLGALLASLASGHQPALDLRSQVGS